ncbi:MAG: PucR family transcriptional regulator ligand-binding domain-containing protein [Actinomycetaceae bacterium]|nr:PucR family transcriptional regulator ligand-binding domain-containing protein [Actinomycetaceae bacterium]
MVCVGDVLSQPHCRLQSLWCPSPEKTIRWVATSDLIDPTPFLEGDELLLTTAQELVDASTQQWNSYIKRLQRHSVSAIGIASDIAVDNIPTAAIRACKRYHMNLFDVPKQTPFVRITRMVAELVHSEQKEGEQRFLHAQGHIIQAVRSMDPLSSCIDVLGKELMCHVALISATKRVLRAHPTHHSIESDSAQRLVEGLQRQSMVNYHKHWAFRCETNTQGYCALVCTSKQNLARWQTDLLHSASLLLGFFLDTQADLRAQSKKLLHHSLLCALQGDLSTTRLLAATVFPLAQPLDNHCHICVIDSQSHNNSFLFDDIIDRLVNLVSPHTPPIIAGMEDHQLVIAISPRLLPFMRSTIDNICTDESLRAGIGPKVTLSDLAHSLHAARAALRITSSDEPVITWQQLRSDDLLRLIGLDTMQTLSQELKNNLRDKELYHTLTSFIHNNGIRSTIAGELGIHRNTLLHRLKKIEEKLDVHLDDPGVRARLWVALQG